MTYPSTSYYTAQVYDTLPQSLQQQDAASGYQLWYFIQALVGVLDSLSVLYFDSMGGGSTVFPVDPAPLAYSPAMLKSNIGATDTSLTVFNTNPTWNQIKINTALTYPGYYSMVKSLKPSAWWKLNEPIGSTTAIDSSGNGNNGTVSGTTNKLVSPDDSFETGIGTWGGRQNASVAQSTVVALHGTHSLAVTATAIGDFAAQTGPYAVTAGTTYELVASAYCPSGSGVKTAVLFTSDTTFNLIGASKLEVQGSWISLSASYVPAAGVTTVQFGVFFLQNGSGTPTVVGEVHYIDKIGLFQGTNTTWVPAGQMVGVQFGQDSPLIGEVTSTGAKFDGSTGSCYTTTTTLLSQTGSICNWFNTTSSAGGVLGNYLDNSGANYLSLGVNASGTVYGQVVAGGAASVKVTSTGSYNDGNWHFAVLTAVGSGTVALYVDGTLIGTISTTANFTFSTSTNYIEVAVLYGGGLFPASICDFALFNYVLTASQVSALYQARTVISTPYDQAVAALAPKAWWKLADAVGLKTALDSSGNNYTGTVNGTVTFGQTGPITGTPADTAALFDGSTGYVHLASLPTLVLSGALTLAAWFKTSSAAGMCIMGSDVRVGMFLSSGALESFLNGANGSPYGSNLNDGHYHFGVVSFAGFGSTSRSVYVDGVLVGTDANGAASDWTGAFDIGHDASYTDYFPGSIAEATVLPFALTPSQVSALYNSSSLLSANPFNLEIESERIQVPGLYYDWTATEITFNNVIRGWDNTTKAAHLASSGATGEFDIANYFGAPGWSQILDINRCPSYALPWLGQFVGVDLSKTPGLTYEQSVHKILSRPGFGRGTTKSLQSSLTAIINNALTGSATPINQSQVIVLENTSPIGFQQATTLFSAITGTGAITLQLTGVGNSWLNAAANSPLVVQIDSEKILIPQGVYSFVNGPVSITIPVGNRGYQGTTAATHLIGASVTVQPSPSLYQYNQYGITLLIPATYFNLYTYNSLLVAAGGSSITYATMDTFIAGLGPTNVYNNLNSSLMPSASNSFANYVYSQRPAGVEVFVGAY